MGLTVSEQIVEGKGVGYVSGSGLKCMIRCFKCGEENYAMAVAAGTCAWCGFDPNVPDTNVREGAP